MKKPTAIITRKESTRLSALAFLLLSLTPQMAFASGPPLQFAKMVGNLLGFAVASDSQSNIYVGSGPYTAPLIKLDPNGSRLWSLGPVTGGGLIEIRGIVVDPSDAVYVCGDLWGNVRVGAIAYNETVSSMFFAKFTSSGSNLFAKVFHNLYCDNKPFAQTYDGGFLVTGRFGNPVTYEGITISPTTSSSDVLLFKINSDGSPVWYRRGTGNLDDFADGVASCSNGAIALAVTCNSTAFGMAGTTASSSGNKNLYLMKMESDGSGAWAKAVSSSLDPGNYITVSSAVAYSAASDAIIWAGDFTGYLNLVSPPISSAGGKDVFVAKISQAGAVSWVRTFTGSQDQFANAATVDRFGNIYIAGFFSGQITIGSLTLTSLGLRDLFLAKLRDDGTTVWAKRIGWTDNDDNVALGFAGNAELLVTGTARGGASIDGVFLEGTNSSDAFVAKFASEGVPPSFSTNPASQVISTGMMLTLTAALAINDPLVQLQWWFNGAPLPGKTNGTLTISNAQSTNAGSYYLMASNDAGTAQSAAALISYTDASTLILSIHPSLAIFGTPGRTYRIEYASEVRSPAQWIVATNLALSSSPQVWVDSAAATGERRFYRVILVAEP